MQQITKTRLLLCNDNLSDLNQKFAWEETSFKRLIAVTYALENRRVDTEKIEEMIALIKKNFGVFSPFNGNIRLFFASKLCTVDNPEDFLNKVNTAFEAFASEKISFGDYLSPVAILLADSSEADDFPTIVKRTKEFYKAMKKEHPFLTDQSDIIYALLFAIKDLKVEHTIQISESLFSEIQKQYGKSNATQSLSFIFTLLGIKGLAVETIESMRVQLKERGIRTGIDEVHQPLASLLTTQIPANQIVGSLEEITKELESIKGMGKWAIGTGERVSFASQFLINEIADNDDAKSSLGQHIALSSGISEVNSILMMQQLSLIIVMNSILMTTLMITTIND